MEGEKRTGRERQSQEPEEDRDEDSCDEGLLTGEVWEPGPWTPLHNTKPQGLTFEIVVPSNSTENGSVHECQSKMVRLQDHIPQSLVFDYKARDMRSLELSGFHHQVTVEEVKQLCKGAVQICHRFGRGCKLLGSTVQYESEQRAVETAAALTEARLRGYPFRVSPGGARWNRPEHDLVVLSDTLNLHGVPEEFYASGKVDVLFPAGDVVGVLLDGTIQVKFASATELIKAVKEPRCWTIGGENIQFSLAAAKKKGTVLAKRNLE